MNDDNTAPMGDLRGELAEIRAQRKLLEEQKAAAEHPDPVEDSADLAEDLVEQETAEALIEAIDRREEQIEGDVRRPGLA